MTKDSKTDTDSNQLDIGDNPNIEVVSIRDSGPGQVQAEVKVGPEELAYLDNSSSFSPFISRALSPQAASMMRAAADFNVTRRVDLSRSELDLVKDKPSTADPHELFRRSIEYYYDEDIYGTSIRLLANLSTSGFRNDIDDNKVKAFFDNWMFDIGLNKVVEDIFFDLFRVGMVRTYKAVGKYEPSINIFPSLPRGLLRKTRKDTSAKKIKWSKSHIPIKYTILNPEQIEISGSLLFDQTYVSLKAGALTGLKDLLDKNEKEQLTEQQKQILTSLPKDMLLAAKNGQNYPLNSYLVGAIDYRRMPYEKYPKPRGVNAFEAINYKRQLRNADYSTLDGITNYILLITVGNDKYPVTKQEVLSNVSELFNTSAKSFDIVWNHTLKIEKIVSPEIEAILGREKYGQVNDDYTGALGISRALIDGQGTINAAGAFLSSKSIISEINYARSQVRRWLYGEYRDVAEAMGFNKYPSVRFDELALRDELEMMRVIQGMIDRRIMSYETGHEKLNLDSVSEKSRLTDEKDSVLSGDLGIIGSPYNPKVAPPMSNPDNVQDTQRTPSGTPSEGRPPEGKGTPDNASVSRVKALLEDFESLSELDKQKLLELIKDSE